MIGEQHAGKSAQRAGNDEAGKPIPKHRKSDRAHAPLVRARAADRHAEARVDDAPDQKDRTEQQHEAKIIKDDLVGEIDEAAEVAAPLDGQSVVTTVAVEPVGDVIDNLR